MRRFGEFLFWLLLQAKILNQSSYTQVIHNFAIAMPREVHKGEDPHRVFGLASIALVTAVNHLRRKGKCCHECNCGQCNDCLFGNSSHSKDNANNSLTDGHGEKDQDDHEYILPIVAIDIAGAESGYPASDHKEAFDLAHQSFLNKTVHAGEAYGPESIFSAITDLHAERIGHGCNLFKWEIIGEGEGRGGRSKSSKEKEELSDDEKRAYVENLTRYLGVSFLDFCSVQYLHDLLLTGNNFSPLGSCCRQ